MNTTNDSRNEGTRLSSARTTNMTSNSDKTRATEKKSPEQLEREVDQARTRLGRTASELSDRLSPGELIDQALDMAREHGGSFGRNLATQVKNNPMPMILTSIGISWLMMSSGKQSNGGGHPSYRKNNSYGTQTDSEEHGLKNALANTAAMSREKVAEMGDHVHDTNVNMKESAQNFAESMTRFYQDQPLITGSLGIAIGAVLGALVPPTELEDDMFGEASDRSIAAAKSKAEEKYDEVRESVS